MKNLLLVLALIIVLASCSARKDVTFKKSDGTLVSMSLNERQAEYKLVNLNDEVILRTIYVNGFKSSTHIYSLDCNAIPDDTVKDIERKKILYKYDVAERVL